MSETKALVTSAIKAIPTCKLSLNRSFQTLKKVLDRPNVIQAAMARRNGKTQTRLRGKQAITGRNSFSLSTKQARIAVSLEDKLVAPSRTHKIS